MPSRLPVCLARHASPAEGCGCAACDAARLDRWRRLSSAQRRAVEALHRTSPRHIDDLARQHVHWRTLASLMTGTIQRPALVMRLDLRRPLLSSPYYSFALLTQHGQELLDAVHRAPRGGA